MAGLFSEITSATAPPNPPIIECSSAVTIAPLSFTAFNITSLSSGFIVDIFMTPILKPSILSSSAASRDTLTIRPQAIILTSSPIL